MHFKNISFNKEETKIIIDQGLLLIKHGYFTAFNLIFSNQNLPMNSVLIHYLQDEIRQVKYMKKEIAEKFEYSEDDLLILERPTFYRFDPRYAEKPNFELEYGNAVFLNADLEAIPIGEVIRKPEEVIVYNKELDLLIPFDERILDINDLAGFILQLDKNGPEPWIDPAIIIRGNINVIIDKFVTAHYCSIGRGNSEFYTIIANDDIKENLEKYLAEICKRLRTRTDVSLKRNSVIFLRGDINKELDDYIKRVSPPFMPL